MHLNPAREGLLTPEQPLASFPWSSFPAYVAGPAGRPGRLRVDRMLGEWGIPQDSAAGRRVFEERLEWRQCGQARDSAGVAWPNHSALAWIAQRLCMGSRGHVAWLLQQKGAPAEAPPGQGFLQL